MLIKPEVAILMAGAAAGDTVYAAAKPGSFALRKKYK